MKKQITKEFWSVLHNLSRISTLLKIVSVPVGIINAKLLSKIVSCATVGDYGGVIAYGGILLGILLAVKIFDIVTQISYQKAEARALQRCKILLYKRYLSSPLHILYEGTVGEANVLLAKDFSTITNKILGLYPTLIAGIVTVIAYFVFLCFQSPRIAFVLLFISTLQVISPLFDKYFCEKYDVDDKELERQITDAALEYYHAFSTIKIFSLKAWCLAQMRKLHYQAWVVGSRLMATYRVDDGIAKLIRNILTYGTYAIVGLFIISEDITIDVGVQAIALSSSLYAAVKTSFEVIPSFGLAKIAEKRMSKFWVVETPTRYRLDEKADIVFRNVFCMLGEKQIFNKINFTIPANELTVLKGANGIGKSTLAKLALGMIEYHEGTICVSGISPQQIAYENYPQNIFYLPQEDAAYHLTAKDLFESVVDNKNMEDGLEILKSFHINESLFGQKISDLSGGERKKIFLALGLALNPQWLILDEPTNSLDKDSCKILYQFLQKRRKGTIVITHEWGLMSIASRIYEIREGGIVSEI